MRTGINLKTCGVYCFIHRDSGRVYIGSAVNIHRRIISHYSKAKKGRMGCFSKALREFGRDAFDVELVETCSKESLLAREWHWILFFNAASIHGFNTISNPTTANLKSNFAYVASNATRERLSVAMKKNTELMERLKEIGRQRRGRPAILTDDGRRRLAEAARNRPVTEKMRNAPKARIGKKASVETIEKQRIAGLRYVPTQETKTKISIGNKGKVRSAQARIRYSIAQKNRPKEITKKIADANRGRRASEETRKKISAKAKQRWMEAKAIGINNLLNSYKQCAKHEYPFQRTFAFV